MKSAISLDLVREVRKSWARFLSIFLIVLIGVGFFAGIKATAPDMEHTADRYLDDNGMMDIRVLSTLGLTKGDVEAIAALGTVERVQPAYFSDAVSTVGSMEYVFRLHSMPVGGQAPVNRVVLTEGRLPEKSGECLLEQSKYLDSGLKVGDTLQVSSGKETAITDGTLKTDTFTIVGKAVSPLYLCFDKGSSDIGNGKVSFFLMVPEEDFAYPVYTEVQVTVKGAEELNCYSETYGRLVEKTLTDLENMGLDRSGLRLAEIKGQATAQLDDAKREYEAKRQEFEQQTAAAREKLEQARVDLEKAESTLASEKANFEITTRMARDQIEQGKKDLAQGEKEYRQGLVDYNKAKAQYSDELAQMDGAVQDINSLRKQAKQEIADMESDLQNPDLSPEEKQRLTQMIAMYRQFLAATEEGINSANELNGFTQGQLSSAEKKLRAARKQLDDGYKKIAASEAELQRQEEEAAAKFTQAEADIASGWAEYEHGKQEYAESTAKGEAELAAGQEKIIKAEDEIERISKPQWIVLDRHGNLSYEDFGMTAGRVDAIATVFPVFFFLVAALVCLTTMTRMVDEQRGAIGIYKALGYSDGAIAAKYICYAAVASTLGGAAGLAVGMSVFPEVIYRSWLMKYEMPPLQTVAQPLLMAVSLLMGVLVTTLTAWAACRKELADAPATLMRPKAPKPGKRILLERLGSFWRRLSFSQKVTMRNLFRYKKRFWMTVAGIAGCTALLVAGFGLNDSISQVVDRQFSQIFTYDLNLRFSADVTDGQRAAAAQSLGQDANTQSWLESAELNAKARGSGEDIAATLVVPQDPAAFAQYVTLRSREGRQPISLDDSGVVLTEKLAKELGVSRGGTIELDNGLGGRKKVTVAAITEQYVFHYIYISPSLYRQVFRLEARMNSLMIRLADSSAKAEETLAQKLIGGGGVASVTFYSALADSFTQTVKSLNAIVLVIILSAGLLAFVVLYNLTNINIGERVREIATVKVLGFTDREQSGYVFRENVLLSLLGAAIGLGLGVLLHRYIMENIEQAGIMFGNAIEPISFGWSFLLTMAFTGFVILVMVPRLKRIPMVESLKSVE